MSSRALRPSVAGMAALGRMGYDVENLEVCYYSVGLLFLFEDGGKLGRDRVRKGERAASVTSSTKSRNTQQGQILANGWRQVNVKASDSLARNGTDNRLRYSALP